MTDKDLTEIVLIVDRSGSMDLILNEANGAVRNFIKTQKELPGKAWFTLAEFDDQYKLVYDGVAIEDVKDEYDLLPRGMTALYDAVGRTMATVGAKLAALPEESRPSKVLVAIITDGLENASTEYIADAVKTMITTQQEMYSWEFAFLGVGIDAFAEGSKIGLARGQTLSVAAGSAGMYAGGQSISGYAASYRSTGKAEWDEEA